MDGSNSIGIGIIEGFFGPEWSWDDRSSIIDFLSKQNGKYYIYAPKRDSYLRKSWTQDHPEKHWEHLLNLSLTCKKKRVKFGIGLSPFDLHLNWNAESRESIRKKIRKLEELDFEYLGIFFDDMVGSEDLAEKQIEIIELVRSVTARTILFCPTYYSLDPILDKVFGERPIGYLDKIGKSLSKDVKIFWTGSKVIPTAIRANELESVEGILGRKPVIWENYFANDGPGNCNFLKLKPFEGRSGGVYQSSSGWAFNLMNQAHLSKVVFLASIKVLLEECESMKAFKESLLELTNSDFTDFVLKSGKELNEIGQKEIGKKGTQTHERFKLKLQDISKSECEDYKAKVAEVKDWFEGKYIVGAECLTD